MELESYGRPMCLPFTTRYTTFMNQTWWIHTAGCTRGWRCVNRLTTSWTNYANSPAKRRLSGPAKTFMTSLCHCKAAVWRVDDVTCLIEWIFKRFVHPVVQLDVQPVTHNWLYESLHDTASCTNLYNSLYCVAHFNELCATIIRVIHKLDRWRILLTTRLTCCGKIF